MSEYERSRRIPASADQVFDQACDIDHLDLWMPRDALDESLERLAEQVCRPSAG